MLKDTKVFRSRMAAFRCIDTRLHCLARVVELGEGRVICLLRSDWVIVQPVRQNRLVNRTRSNSFSYDFNRSDTFE